MTKPKKLSRKKLKKSIKIKRNTALSLVAKNDPTRYKERTVLPEKGLGRKERPRDKLIDSE